MVLWDAYVVNSRKFYYEEHEKRNKSRLLQRVDFDVLAEDHGFTTLHKIVCEIDLRDLDLELQRHPDDIDKLDRHSRSPLWYAVAYCNTQFVRCLLERGADPNLGGSAVLTAIQWRRLEIVELIITSGFNIMELDMNDLLVAWYYTDSWALNSLIISNWVDVNRQTSCGITMLMFICSLHRHDANSTDQLIRRGAELELRDRNGETALIYCINGLNGLNADAFQTLVHAGARLDVQDYTGATVLHHVVLLELFAELPLLKAMQDVDVSQFDLEARDEEGHTAFDILKKRNGITWESYYEAKRGKWYASGHYSEIRHIRGLESFFHHIQDAQGIPKEQQYPPLADYLCEQPDNKAIPGAWPL